MPQPYCISYFQIDDTVPLGTVHLLASYESLRLWQLIISSNPCCEHGVQLQPFSGVCASPTYSQIHYSRALSTKWSLPGSVTLANLFKVVPRLRSLGYTQLHSLLQKTCQEKDTSSFCGPILPLPESGRTRVFLPFSSSSFCFALLPMEKSSTVLFGFHFIHKIT